MKKLIISFLFLSLFSASELNAQCRKNKTINKSHYELATSQKCGINNRDSTELSYLFNYYTGLGRMASGNFVKYGSEFYCYLDFIISNCENFNITSTNPLEFYLSNMESIKVFPCGNASGIYSGLADYSMQCFYKISREDLEKLGKFEVLQIKIYYTASKMIDRSQVGQDGSYFLEFEVKESYHKWIVSAANCLLNK